MRRLTILLAAFALAAAACSSAGADENVASLVDSSTTSTAAADEEAGFEEAILAFAECMRQYIPDFPDPEFDANGNLRIRRDQLNQQFDQDALREGRDACIDLLEGVAAGFTQQDFTEIQDRLVEYAACMRDNGYDMPDPQFGGGPGGLGGPGGRGPFGDAANPDDPAFQAANEQCLGILSGLEIGPGRGRPGGGRLGNGEDR
ncbi:MAG: hypothetical protein ACE5E8_05500 [Acidimicrobiia bacterium]